MVALNDTYRRTHTLDRPAQHSGHRFYSPEISRWLSRDPAGKTRGTAFLYTWLRNSPLLYVDPLGEDPAPVSPVGLTYDIGAGTMTISYLPGYSYSPPSLAATTSGQCCGLQIYDPSTECCCLYGFTVENTPDLSAAKVPMAAVGSGAHTFGAQNPYPGILYHEWVEWNGEWADYNNMNNDTYMYGSGPYPLTGQDKGHPPQLSPCQYNIDKFKEKLTFYASGIAGVNFESTASYDCQNYTDELIDYALANSAGCTMPPSDPEWWVVGTTELISVPVPTSD